MGQIDKVWGGDWRGRVVDRVSTKGFRSVSEFVASRPAQTYAELAIELGEDIAPVQVSRLHLKEAHEEGAHAFREASKDSLVRFIRERLPLGWNRKPVGKEEFDHDFLNGAPWSTWATAIDEVSPDDARAHEDAVWEQLQAHGRDGWLPASSDDEVIRSVFDKAWPT